MKTTPARSRTRPLVLVLLAISLALLGCAAAPIAPTPTAMSPGILAGLFVASPEDVAGWDLGLGSAEWPAVEVDLLEIHLGTLESIITGTPYDEISDGGLHDIVREGGDEGPWVIAVRPQLVEALADLEEARIPKVAAQWADTDEMKLDPAGTPEPAVVSTLADLLPEMRALASTSLERRLPMYLLVRL